MSDFQYKGDTELLEKLQRNFAGKIVRKDLTKRIKEGADTDRDKKEAVDTAYRYLKANAKSISGSIRLTGYMRCLLIRSKALDRILWLSLIHI